MTRDRITVNDVLALDPCPAYPRERVEELWHGRESLTLAEVLALDIPAGDRLWLALTPEFFSEEELRLMAADFAERAILAHWPLTWDFRPAAAVVASRRFARGEVGAEELMAAESAAWDAASAYAGDAASAAAWAASDAAGAAGTAAEAAARAAARAYAGDAAGAAAWAAEREAQVAIVLRYLGVQA